MERTQELSVVESALGLRTSELDAIQAGMKELEELREMKEVRVLFSGKFPLQGLVFVSVSDPLTTCRTLHGKMPKLMPS